MRPTPFVYPCKLVRVVDGDTICVSIDCGFDIWMLNQTVRLYDIDTPEIFGRNATAAGHEAKDFTEKWLAAAKRLSIVSRKYDDREKYGRILGEIYRDDDPVPLNIALEEAGHRKV
jgi:endonuclease YncB( thermonuclease family)